MDLLVLVIIVGAFVLMLMLPMRRQQRLAREAQAMQSALQVGDEVMTTSGMYGRIAALGDDTVDLEISEDVVVRWTRAAIREVTSRVGDPAGATDEAEPADELEGDSAADAADSAADAGPADEPDSGPTGDAEGPERGDDDNRKS